MLSGFFAAAFFILSRELLIRTKGNKSGNSLAVLVVNRLFFLSLMSMLFGFIGFMLMLEKGGPSGQEVALPGETGWIFAGYFDESKGYFTEGPYVSVADTAKKEKNRFIEMGDKIVLNVNRKLIIVDFKKTGPEKKLISPVTKGVLENNDDTGILLSKDSTYLVRDVSEGKWPESSNSAVWLRVINSPK